MSNITHYAYYGEYTIKSWIEFILNSEIKLPDYQRKFVWNVKQAGNLIDSILNGSFISPLTIVSTRQKIGEMEPGHYLLDGQQRISSILLFTLGKWINKGYQKENSDDGDDRPEFVEWTFNNLQVKYKDCNGIEELKGKIKDGYCEFSDIKTDRYITKKDIDEVKNIYNKLKENKEEFFAKKLGYAFIKSIGGEEVERKLYAKLFREINSSGVKLSPSESRTAMYYIVPQLKNLFEPEFLKNYKIAREGSIDLTRYLTYAYRWYELNVNEDYNIDKIARGYSGKLEEYVLEYVSEVTENYAKNNSIYDKQIEQVKQFEEIFKGLFSPSEISVWEISDVEWNLFGLIYWTIFHNRKIDMSKKSELLEILKKSKPETGEKRVGAIRDRLRISVDKYKEFIQEEKNNG
jgi:hypothetical protein